MPAPITPQQRLHGLIDAVAPCWAGEALVARRYFGGTQRSAARDARWIGFQVFKEHSGGGVYGGPGATVTSILASAAARAAGITLATPPDEAAGILADLEFALDELRHMSEYLRLYALAGGDPGRSIESLGQLEHADRLRSLRHRLRATGPGRMAVDLSEGGGLGLHFGLHEHFAAQPPATPLDVELARLTDAVLADESRHLLARFRAALTVEDSDATWAGLQSALLAICTEKLRERNEQFCSPLSEAEISQVVADRPAGRDYVQSHLQFLLDGL